MKNIYLEPNEEIISVVDRLVQTDDNDVSLVVPTGAQIWHSSINLKLLKREADSLKKAVTFIVSDDLGAEMAERIGFAVKRERNLPVELVQEQDDEVVQDEVIQQQDQKDEIIKPEEDEAQVEEPVEAPEQVVEQDKEQGDAQMAQSKENMIDILVDELESDKKAKKPLTSLSSWRKKPPQEVSGIREGDSQRKMADIVTPTSKAKSRFFQRPVISRKPPVEEPRPIPEPAKVEPVPEKRVFTEKPSGSGWPKLFIIFIVVALIVAGVVSYLVLPNAEVSITPKTEIITFDLSVIGSESISQIDETLNQIPLQEVEVIKTKTGEFSTTGEKDISEKARGSITVYNEYSSSPQTLVATTRFQSSDGKVFRIPESVTVPGAAIEEGKIIPSTLEVEVIADQPGDGYNIGPADFSVPGFKGTPKYAGFYGKSSDSMSGGYVGKARVVLAEDLEEAENTLVEELKSEVSRALEDQIPTDLKILEDGSRQEVTKISSSHKQGEQADKFTLEMKVSMKVLLFNEEDLKSLVNLNLVSRISEDRTPIDKTQKISWQTPSIDWLEGEASFSLSVEEGVAWTIDTQSLKQDLVDQNETEVRRYLANQSDIEKAKVSFWPFWVKKMPSQEEKIKVNIEF